MYCANCGKTLNNNEEFCSNCGHKNNFNINQNSNSNIQNNNMNMNYSLNNDLQNNNMNNSQDNIDKKILKKYKISKIIGFITIILTFIIRVFAIPIAIGGIIFGVICTKKNSNYNLGLILCIISLIIAIPLNMAYDIIVYKPRHQLVGTWYCKNFNNGYYEDLDYIVTMKISNNKKFMWAKHGDEENNYVVGKYEMEKLNKFHQNATFYNIKLTGETYISEGELQTEKYKSEYEVGLENTNKDVVMINPYTYQMYYCRKIIPASPKIKKY